MKYVRLRRASDAFDTFVFGLAPTTHAQLAEGFRVHGTPVSAGFLQIDPLAPCGCRTLGRSDTLNLGPAPADAELIGFLYGATLRLAPLSSSPSTPHIHHV